MEIKELLDSNNIKDIKLGIELLGINEYTSYEMSIYITSNRERVNLLLPYFNFIGRVSYTDSNNIAIHIRSVKGNLLYIPYKYEY